ncbi:Hypp2045 [Branchiostoma lanceolatum]|uniref:Hypp2045 protein n=1 Tax=Branchiostoma lanceolatum TaxID=7740 RepID=A0A8K0ERR8_BRALA|nr:Hypp2045 [Branchiostoma lanceolatum]
MEMAAQKTARLTVLALAVTVLSPAAEAKTIPQGGASVVGGELSAESQHERAPGRVWTANPGKLTSQLSSQYAGLMNTQQGEKLPTQACGGGVRLSTALGTVAAAAVAGMAAGVALTMLVCRPARQRLDSKHGHVRTL